MLWVRAAAESAAACCLRFSGFMTSLRVWPFCGCGVALAPGALMTMPFLFWVAMAAAAGRLSAARWAISCCCHSRCYWLALAGAAR